MAQGNGLNGISVERLVVPLVGAGGGIVLRSPEEVAGAAGSGSSLPALQESLDIRNTLLLTCHLRNTSWVIGVVINTGNETKFGMCKGAVPTKVSRVDRWIDCFTASVFCGQVLLLLLLLMMVMRMMRMMTVMTMVMTMMAMMMWRRRKMMMMMMVVVVFFLATAAAALDCSRSSASLPIQPL